MSSITEFQAKLIMISALRTPVLIITGSEKVAMQLKDDILTAMRQVAVQNIVRQDQRYKVMIKGYEIVTIMPLDRWIKDRSRLTFDGAVLITNHKLTNIPRIVQQPVMITEYLKEWEELYGRKNSADDKSDRNDAENDRI